MADGTFYGALRDEAGRWRGDARRMREWVRGGGLKRALGAASEIVRLVPAPGDSPLTLAAKGLAAVAAVEKATRRDDIFDYAAELAALDHMTAVPDECATFANRCLPAPVRWVTQRTTSTSSGMRFELLRAELPYGPALALRGDADILRMWVGFDIERLSSGLWEQLGGRGHLASKKQDVSQSGRSSNRNENFEVTPITRADSEMYGHNADTTRALTERLRRYMARRTPRSFLLAGPPGTGKSTAVEAVATALGLTLLRVDCKYLAQEPEAVMWAVRQLRPGILLLDDFDRVAKMHVDMSGLLSWMTDIRAAGTYLFVTANNVKAFPTAMVRPGRLDEVLFYGHPDDEARRCVLSGYLKRWEVDASDETLEALVRATEGEPEATLRACVAQLREDTLENVIGLLAVRREVLRGKPSDDDSGDCTFLG